jgi:hypothetical protein
MTFHLHKIGEKAPTFFLEYIDRGIVKGDGEQPFELPFQVQFFEQDPKRALALLNYNLSSIAVSSLPAILLQSSEH